MSKSNKPMLTRAQADKAAKLDDGKHNPPLANRRATAKTPSKATIAKRIAAYKAKDAAPKPRVPRAAPQPTPANKTKLAAALRAGLTSSDVITTVGSDHGGTHVCINAPGQPMIFYPKLVESKALKALAVVGGSYAKLAAYIAANPIPKPQARLATGVDAHVAPHSAKAVADQRRALKTTPAPKGAKNKQPSAGQDYTYKPGKAFDRKAGTWTEYMVNLIRAHKNTASAKAAHAAGRSYTDKKLDFAWCVTQGFIKR